MKVNIDRTIEVDDDNRVRLANVIDQKVTRRQATREELKSFVWEHGASWEERLSETFLALTGGDRQPDPDPEPEDDLLGGGDDDLLGTGEPEAALLGEGDDDDDLLGEAEPDDGESLL